MGFDGFQEQNMFKKIEVVIILAIVLGIAGYSSEVRAEGCIAKTKKAEEQAESLFKKKKFCDAAKKYGAATKTIKGCKDTIPIEIYEKLYERINKKKGQAKKKCKESQQKIAKTQKPKLKKQIQGTDGVDMYLIPKGTFIQGTSDSQQEELEKICQQTHPYPDQCHNESFEFEQPTRSIKIDAFYMDITEITNAQYRVCVSEGHCQSPDYAQCSVFTEGIWETGGFLEEPFFQDDGPVVCVSFENAQNYCNWAGERLPTEAEWERAARGDDSFIYPWGEIFLPHAANWNDVFGRGELPGSQDGFPMTAPVNSFPEGKSPYEIADLAGNVWEWTADWFSEDAYRDNVRKNPIGPAQGALKIIRGGAWNDTGSYLRSASRFARYPEEGTNDLGFRCVKNTK